MNDQQPALTDQVAPPLGYAVGLLRADGQPTLVTLALATVHGVAGFVFDREDATQLIEKLTAVRDQLPVLDVVRELPPELREKLN